MSTKFLLKTAKGVEHLKGVCVDKRIILKLIFKIESCGLESSGLTQGPSVGSYTYDNELSNLTK